jgi:carboxypeptidase C (cathepsin A)
MRWSCANKLTLADGFLYEHGPFRVGLDANKNATLTPFEFSWNKKASTIYIESPVGVGFSYSSDPADLICDDDSQAVDNLNALKSFFAKFPDFASRDFYITGESYGGIYVPTLAEAILKDKSWTEENNLPDLKGIAVGNGCSGTEVGICSWGDQGDVYSTKYLMSAGFVPETLKDQLNGECDFKSWFAGDGKSATCDAAVAELNTLTKDLDSYCVYCDCAPQTAEFNYGQQNSKIAGANKLLLSDDQKLSTTACINSVEASAFLNDPAVQEAIHVKVANNNNWSVCGTQNGWDYSSTRPNLPRDTYPFLIDNIRVLIYNGDHDACVPYTDGEGWTSGMNLDTDNAWHPWYFDNNNNVGGYATSYKTSETGKGSFEFITVKGGRHEVPETEPVKAFVMLDNFLNGIQF